MSIEMYGDYINEKFGKDIIYSEHGFLTYLAKDVFYIEEIYIKPEARHSGEGQELGLKAETIARDKKYKEVFGSVSIQSATATRAMRILLEFGYKLHSIKADLIFLKKDL